MSDFVRRQVISTKGGAMIRRHEKLSAPVAEHEPQRLLVSRTVMRLAGMPSAVYGA